VAQANSAETIVAFEPGEMGRARISLQRLGARVINEYNAVSTGVYRIPAPAMEQVRRTRGVRSVTPNQVVEAAALDFAWETTGAQQAASQNLTGNGIGVAVIDSGIFDHADLTGKQMGNSRVHYVQDFIGGDGKDQYGHGTHVAGIIAGNGKESNGNGYTYRFGGAAPNVRLLNLRVLDHNGKGTDAAVIAAINRAIQLKPVYNIRVINLSVGRPFTASYKNDPLCLAVEAAWKAGIVMVVAAGNHGRDNTFGNQGYGTITAPGNSPWVITVGATNTNHTASRSDDRITSYSSKGPTAIDRVVKPDLVAPGNRLISLLAGNTTIYNSTNVNRVPFSVYKVGGGSSLSDKYYRLSGTSMAAPQVTAAVALMLQKYPSLTPDTVKARLMKTATKSFPASSTSVDPVTGVTYVSYHDIFTVGAGYLDIAAALANTDVANLPALSPAVTIGANGAAAIVSGTNLLWGSNILWGTNLVWGSNMVWGTNFVWGTNLLWGTNLIWGTGVPEASSTSLLVNGDQ